MRYIFSFGGLLMALAVGLFVLLIWAIYQEDKQWQQFKAEHHCVKVGEIAPTVTTGIAVNPANGQVSTVTTSDGGKTGWKCDDGVTYWR